MHPRRDSPVAQRGEPVSPPAALEADAFRLFEVEARVNEILRRQWNELSSNPATQAYYRAIFDRTVEEGFYSDPNRASGEGSGSGPNEAYLLSHEKMWEAVDGYLKAMHLKVDGTFRELFFSSREYEDSETEHRRVFCGHLCNFEGRPVTAFMLTVPHSHRSFRYPTPMQIVLPESGLLAVQTRAPHQPADRPGAEIPANEEESEKRGVG
jgi:hypothetical protein